ncbi:hypothetical protein BKA70DRAFT_1308906 [Coprinopsis sp. MPI-PUGE-AT-0042]|nr:hypothetical protein BKA70DRAFT_1308906 [Coprinopsis sp. MPI-PUGE-AT-0042]
MLKHASFTPLLCTILFCVSSTLAQAWSSPLSGFLDRAAAYTNTAAFQPPRSSLELVVLRNAQAEPDGFTLAFYSSDGTSNSDTYAVDAAGSIYVLQQQDATEILALANEVASLPETGEFRNTWFLKSPVTSRPIERILIPKGSGISNTPAANYETEFDEVSVYGFNYVERELEQTTNGLDLLPEPLWELTGLVLQARNDNGAILNQDVVSLVRGMVQNAF